MLTAHFIGMTKRIVGSMNDDLWVIMSIWAAVNAN